MAVFPYKKYKISLNPDSSKVQGLKVGDIIRRQYYDNQLEKEVVRDLEGNVIEEKYTGKNVGSIYNLMCVLETGEDITVKLQEDGTPVIDSYGNEVQLKQPWFIGALLEGTDTPPKQGELLDFVRITNLFDTNRSGALYLTASDEMSPYMDVIDGLGRSESLCWPIDINTSDQPDCETQYYLQGAVTGKYMSFDDEGHNRILHVTKQAEQDIFTGLQQDFYKYVTNPNMVLVSYKAKTTSPSKAYVSMGYVNDSKFDTESPIEIDLNNEWQYYLHAITVDWSGRHLRTVKLDLGSLQEGDEAWISDFNIILLSSVSNFDEKVKTRIGRLEGIVDPVFGRLDGYGGYLQKLYASQSAHISGTLTAGDENGFGASFYAGKIHKNVLINSVGLNTVGGVIVDKETTNPTGTGNVIKITDSTGLIVQSNDWLLKKIGLTYTFSFWVYCKKPCVIDLYQNNKTLGALYIDILQTHQWVRVHKTFTIKELESSESKEDLILTIDPTFKDITDSVFGNYLDNQFTNVEDIEGDTLVADCDELLFSAPQLESGEIVTQYQPTDDILNYTEDYGAWFDRGGIGGTIQNPLLRLNYDGKGGIATRPVPPPDGKPSFALNQDGSGHVAQGKISWDENGDVTFDESVHLNWENLSDDVKNELVGKAKSIKINGVDNFTIIGDNYFNSYSSEPDKIVLTLEEVNLTSGVDSRIWQYLSGYEWVDFPEGQNNGKTLTINPFNTDPDYWDGNNQLTVRCIVWYNNTEYTDTFTIKKVYVDGLIVEVSSTNGTAFKNYGCNTILVADVYYKGQLLDPEIVKKYFSYRWVKYTLVDGTPVQDEDFWGEPGSDFFNQRGTRQVVLDYSISGVDLFSCELLISSYFPLDFPVIFIDNNEYTKSK